MSAAAFEATFAGLRSMTDGDYRISFDFPGEKLEHVVAVLAQGGKPSAAKGTWFAIARLNIGGAVPTERNLTIGNTSEHGAARQRAALLSNRVYLRLCNNPVGRRFLEEFCQDIVMGRGINDPELAKDVVRWRLGISSLSEVDNDPVASEQAEQLLNLFAGWERGLETPRIQQENQA